MKRSARRRRSRPSLAARLRKYWLAGLVVAAAAAWGIVTLVRLPALHVRSLEITGLAHVPRDDVVAAAAIAPDANAWLLDRSAMRRRIEALPYVDQAHVHVRPVADVWIEVSERVADACVRDAAGIAVTVDGALRVLERGCGATPVVYRVHASVDRTPGDFLHDPELAALQADARALAGRGDRYREFERDDFGQLEATLADGIRVRFGDDEDLERKQRLIGPILAQLGPRAGDVRTVDLRAPATPVVEYRR